MLETSIEPNAGEEASYIPHPNHKEAQNEPTLNRKSILNTQTYNDSQPVLGKYHIYLYLRMT
jgi:hypothetical protein